MFTETERKVEEKLAIVRQYVDAASTHIEDVSETEYEPAVEDESAAKDGNDMVERIREATKDEGAQILILAVGVEADIAELACIQIEDHIRACPSS